MKTLDELKAFADGYTTAIPHEDRSSTDDWVVWGGYDINLAGNEYAGPTDMPARSLYVVAYPGGWCGALPDPICDFVANGGKP